MNVFTPYKMNGVILFLLMLTGCNAETISVSSKPAGEIKMICKYNTALGQGYTYRWYRFYTRGSSMLQDGDKYSGTGTETLTIKRTEKNDTGDYMCVYYKDKPSQGIWGTRYKLTVNVDEQWTSWSDWDMCPVTCGGGRYQSRSRQCNNPELSVKNCTGNSDERRECGKTPCPVDGQWSDWSGWDGCPITCGGGSYHRRSRQCSNPSPEFGGTNCTGNGDERRECGKTPCPVDGNWSDWLGWNTCSATCGGGTQYRYRSCSNPPPSGGGKDCEGSKTDSKPCETQRCPGWGAWKSWRSCDTTCGEGYEMRERNCIYRKSVDDNRLCQGHHAESRYCHISPCQGEIGRTINITCAYIDNISWYKDKHHIHDIENEPAKYTKNSNYLMIKNLKYSDDGQYYCDRLLNSGSKTEFIVKGRPTLLTGKDKYYANRGSSKTIRCIPGDSNPALTTLWWTKRPSYALLNDPIKYSGGTLSTPDLTINRVNDTDAGEYTCHGNNGYGVTTANTSVIVGDVPIVIVPQKYYVSRVDESVTLQCTVQNGSTIYWKKGKDILQSGNRKYSRKNVQNPSLTISNIKTSDSGTYSCIANSSYGEVSDKTELKVIYAHAPNTQFVKTAKETVVLKCIVNDFEKNTWLHNNATLQILDNNKYIIGTNKEPDLTITNLTRLDRGIYFCQSSIKDMVERSDIITLDVKDVPFIEPSQTTVEVIAGNDISLPCIYDAYPEATEMYWKKDGDKLLEDFIKYIGGSLLRPNLTIIKSGIDDSRIYSCVVRNSMGSGFSGNIQLIITEPDSQLNSSIVAGIIISVLVVVALVVGLVVILCIKRKKQTKNSRNIYTLRDVNQVEEHSYMQNQENPQNGDEIYAEVVAQEHSVQSHDVLTAYDLGEFSDILYDVQLCSKKIQDEFQWLTKHRPEYESASLSDYDDVDTRDDGFVNTTILKKGGNEVVSVITKPPNEFTIDIFWHMMKDKKISDVIWLTRKGEKLMDIFQTIDDPIEVSGLQIKLTSSERKANGIVLYSVQLIDKEKKTIKAIQFYKSTKWKATQRFPDVELLKDLVTIPMNEGVVIMGSKGIGLRTCGILRVCLEVIQTATDNGKFNMLEIAMRLNETYQEFFKTFEEYELCYQVVRKYIENEHHYYYIE